MAAPLTWPFEPATRDGPSALRWRIVAALLLASLVPLALVAGGAWVVFGRLLLQETLSLQRNLVQHHAAALDQHLRERLHALQVVLRDHHPEDLAEQPRLQAVFATLDDTYPRAFVDLGLIDQAGVHRAYVGPYDLKERNYATAEWFRAVLERDSFVSDVFLGYRQEPHCVIAVARRHQGALWILRATINSESLTALVRSIDLGANGDAFIVNREGRFQTPPRRGEVLGAAGFVPEPHRGLRDDRLAVDGQDTVQVSTWLNDNRWLLVVRRAAAEILAPVDRAVSLGLLAVLIAVALVAAATFVATSHLTNRIRRAQDQRDALSRDLVRSAKLASLGELSTGLAHEINNPLAVISAEQTNIADLIAELQLSDTARAELTKSVERCARQVARCAGITAKMLQFGRKTDANPQLTDVGNAIHEISSLMKRQTQVRNIALRIELEPDLPQVVLDSNELEQVLVNLINNAVFAMPRGGSITISARHVGPEVQIAVSDTGTGIAAEHLERIFQPFFTTKPVGHGTGLGLAVCYGIVRGWGGTIDAQSTLGQGTTMTIHLPVPAAHGAPAWGDGPVRPAELRRGNG